MSTEAWGLVFTAAYACMGMATWLWLVWHDRGDGMELMLACVWPITFLIGALDVVDRASDTLADCVRKYREERRARNDKEVFLKHHPFPPPPPLRDEQADTARKEDNSENQSK